MLVQFVLTGVAGAVLPAYYPVNLPAGQYKFTLINLDYVGSAGAIRLLSDTFLTPFGNSREMVFAVSANCSISTQREIIATVGAQVMLGIAAVGAAVNITNVIVSFDATPF